LLLRLEVRLALEGCVEVVTISNEEERLALAARGALRRCVSGLVFMLLGVFYYRSEVLTRRLGLLILIVAAFPDSALGHSSMFYCLLLLSSQPLSPAASSHATNRSRILPQEGL